LGGETKSKTSVGGKGNQSAADGQNVEVDESAPNGSRRIGGLVPLVVIERVEIQGPAWGKREKHWNLHPGLLKKKKSSISYWRISMVVREGRGGWGGGLERPMRTVHLWKRTTLRVSESPSTKSGGEEEYSPCMKSLTTNT